MDDFLAVEILKLIKKGESFGYITVRNDIKNMESFVTLTDEEFKETMTNLQKMECIKHISHNAYGINPEKDCIKALQNRLDKVAGLANEKAEINRLTLLTLQLQADKDDLTSRLAEAQLEDIPKNAADRKTIIFWQVATGVSVAVAFLLKLFGVKPWL